jgi:hypothetical protein
MMKIEQQRGRDGGAAEHHRAPGRGRVNGMKGFRRGSLVLAALASTAGIGQPAVAQTAPGQMSNADLLGNVKVLRDLEQFGRCYATTNRSTALDLIATKPGSKEEDKVYRRLTRFDQHCLFSGTRMYASVVYIRGAIAEGLLETDGVPANLQLPAPTAGGVTSLSEAARCYVSGRRAEVRALLEMRAGTPEEVAAIKALWNDFRACLPPRANVRLNALWIRFLLAEALLRLPPPTAAAAGN